jgi:hypothetical protein
MDEVSRKEASGKRRLSPFGSLFVRYPPDMLRRLGTWLIFAATGAGLLAGVAATLKDGPSVVPGILLTLGAPCLLVGVVGAVWDIVKSIGARTGRSGPQGPEAHPGPEEPAPRTAVSIDQVQTPTPVSLDSRTSQDRQWDADRLRLVEEGEAIAQTLRGLELDPNDDGYKKNLASSRTTRDAKNWITSVDEFEDHWTPGGTFINRNYLARVVGGMTFVPSIRVPRPPWRQQLVGQIEFRLDRLKKRPVPPYDAEPVHRGAGGP